MEFQTARAGHRRDGASDRSPPNSQMELDAKVIARLCAGDIGALEDCYRAHGPRVQRLCRRLVGRDQADDAAQEVFVKVFENCAKFNAKSSFSTWLYRVTLNHCLKRLERERRRRSFSLPHSQTSDWGEAGLRAVDDRDQVEHWISTLNPEHRAVLVLREIEGLDYQQIADVLDLPVGTVMSRLHRARTKLIELERAPRVRATDLGVIPT